jgi:xeroderma pigmentosum group C-complementing protein
LLNAEAEQSKLYGIWQTTPWMSEVARGGIVPKNERGQVDLWDRDPAHLPGGCVHLNYPRMEVLCKKMGVDCARAFTGFDIKHGRTVPRFEGVVVCAEFEADVMAAWHEAERRASERAEKKRMDVIIANWRHVVRGTIVAAKLRAALGAKEGQSVLGPDGQPIVAAPAGSATAGASAAAGSSASASGSSTSLAAMPYGSIAIAGAALQKPGGGAAASSGGGGAAGGGSSSSRGGGPHVHVFTEQRFDETSNAWVRVCACGVPEAVEEF